MRTRAVLFATVMTLALVPGCGGSGGRGSVTSSGSGPQQGVACLGLTPDAVEHATGISSIADTALAPDPAAEHRCGTAYFDGSGALVVQVQASAGSSADLRRAARFAAVSAGGGHPERDRPLRGFGPGAFIVGDRVVGFLDKGRVVTVQTGYSSSGGLTASPSQLKALARAISSTG